MLNLTDIYNLKLATIFHKIKSKTYEMEKVTSLQNIHNYKTRLSHSENFYTDYKRTTIGQSTSIFNGVKIWRKIPSNLKSLPLPSFKKQLKHYFLQHYVWFVTRHFKPFSVGDILPFFFILFVFQGIEQHTFSTKRWPGLRWSYPGSSGVSLSSRE